MGVTIFEDPEEALSIDLQQLTANYAHDHNIYYMHEIRRILGYLDHDTGSIKASEKPSLRTFVNGNILKTVLRLSDC